jgi:voltage-gated potassium channel
MNHRRPTSHMVIVGLRLFISEVFSLIKSPVFILLTLLGNSLIGLFSLVFFFIEQGTNPRLHSLIDALWWGFATATTTGYGDITPVTVQGKILGILLMLTGTALFAMFTALFAETILANTRQNKF